MVLCSMSFYYKWINKSSFIVDLILLSDQSAPLENSLFGSNRFGQACLEQIFRTNTIILLIIQAFNKNSPQFRHSYRTGVFHIYQ